MALTDMTASVASGNNPGRLDKKTKEASPRVKSKKSATNRSITCSEELRNRIRKMSEETEVPMQRLIERYLREGLEKDGY